MEKGQSIRTKEYIVYFKVKGHNKWFIADRCYNEDVAKIWAQRLEDTGHVDVEVREVIKIESVIKKSENDG